MFISGSYLVCLCLMAGEGSIGARLLLGAPSMHRILGLNLARHGQVDACTSEGMWSMGGVGVGTCVD